MGSQNAERPPIFEPINAVELLSTEKSKIVGVSVYSGRAEVTRIFKFTVRTGQNQVTINGLPNVLDQESLRSVLDVLPNTIVYSSGTSFSVAS